MHLSNDFFTSYIFLPYIFILDSYNLAPNVRWKLSNFIAILFSTYLKQGKQLYTTIYYSWDCWHGRWFWIINQAELQQAKHCATYLHNVQNFFLLLKNFSATPVLPCMITWNFTFPTKSLLNVVAWYLYSSKTTYSPFKQVIHCSFLQVQYSYVQWISTSSQQTYTVSNFYPDSANWSISSAYICGNFYSILVH